MTLDLSIIIPTKHSPSSLDRLVIDLSGQDFPLSRVQLIIIHNIPETLRKNYFSSYQDRFGDFKYLGAGEPGVNFARNLGLKYATGKILYFLDDDCSIPSRDQLSKIIKAHQDFPDFAGIGGRYHLIGDVSDIDLMYAKIASNWLDRYNYCEYAEHLIGGNMSFKRDYLDKGIAFDDRIIFGGAEVSFTSKVRALGGKLKLIPELEINHTSDLTLRSFIQKAYKQGQGQNFNKDFLTSELYHRQDIPLELNERKEELLVYLYDKAFWLGKQSGPKTNVSTLIYWIIRLFGIQLHWSWPHRLANALFHTTKKYLWFFKMPFVWLFHNSKTVHWLIVKVPFHNIKKRVFLIKMPFIWLFHNSRTVHWVIVKIPFHNIKRRIFYLKMPFIWLFHLTKNMSFCIYNFLKTYHWVWKIPLHKIKMNHWLWKVPLHYIKKNLWKSKLPFYKIYYMWIYHWNTYVLRKDKKKNSG